jgi:chemotaxis protein MotB
LEEQALFRLPRNPTNAGLNMARKKKHEDHDNHERWLVSYADFITLLFAFFVVMYAISSINEGKYRVLSESLVNAFQNVPHSAESSRISPNTANRSSAAQNMLKQPTAIKKGDPAQESRRKRQEEKMKGIAKDILKVLEPLVKEGQVRVSQSVRGVMIEINASVLFAPGQAVLEKDSVRVLKAVAQVLAGVENAVQVEGHTDNVPIGTLAYPSNWELSTARASSVVRLFIENGVAPSRLTALGYAENRPVESNDAADGRARNRRVTVMIQPDAQEAVTLIPLGGGASPAR